jgi:hypothetical protein
MLRNLLDKAKIGTFKASGVPAFNPDVFLPDKLDLNACLFTRFAACPFGRRFVGIEVSARRQPFVQLAVELGTKDVVVCMKSCESPKTSKL